MKGWVVFGVVLFLSWRFSRKYPVLNGAKVNPITALPYMLGFRTITNMAPSQGDLTIPTFSSGGANTSAGPAVDPLAAGQGVAITFDKL